MVLTFGYEVIKQRHTGVEYNNIWPDQISVRTIKYITVMWNNQKGKKRKIFYLFFKCNVQQILKEEIES